LVACFLEPVSPQVDDIAIGADQYAEITEKRPHASDGLGTIVSQCEDASRFHDPRNRKISAQTFLDRDGACPRPSPAVRCGERLVQIHMQYVDAHVTRLGDTYQRIEICAVEINQASIRVNQ